MKLSSLYLVLSLLTLVTLPMKMTAQKYLHSIRGLVIDKKTREPLPFVNVVIWNSTIGSQTDLDGKFVIEDQKSGNYRLQVSSVGYKTYVSPEFMVGARDEFVNIELDESSTALGEVQVVADPFKKPAETPLALRVIGFKEIENSAGSNRDISRVVNSFPGVASSPAGFRNDLIVRGGGPNENRFYLDGIEVPNINHFATQGASGGPVGLINADLVRDVDFYSGAFPGNRGNAMSSVMEFKLKEGDPNEQKQSFVVGSSDFGVTLDGHFGDKTTYLFSGRVSYLQLLFKAIGLPFLPTYYDSQIKIKHKFNKNNEITFIGLLGIDDMTINKDTVGFSDANKYTWSTIGIIQQQTYTFGANYKHYAGRHTQSVALSYSGLVNDVYKHINNDDSKDKIFDNNSYEGETKLRIENNSSFGSFKLNQGINIEHANYSNTGFQRFILSNQDGAPIYNSFNTKLNFIKWGAFLSAVYQTPNERFTSSFALRTDANSYSDKMNNWYKQISPRVSLSYSPFENFYLNANIGRYHQHPTYTVMGYQNSFGKLANKEDLKMQYSDQVVAGVEYRLAKGIRLTVEGFYKKYGNVLISKIDSIPLASKGNDYGVFGNEPVTSNGEGKAYGAEAFMRIFGYKGLNLMAAYTWVRSEYYSPRSSKYIPSSWDNRHLLSLTAGYDLPKNWKLGAKLRYTGGAPYTPWDEEASSLKQNWDATERPVLDFQQYNTKRLPSFTQLDLRVDKQFFFKRFMLGVYLDLQNALNAEYKSPEALLSTGVIANPEAPIDQQRYIMKRIDTAGGNILPSIGIMIRL
ncbi:MAG: TonB-dependent receptor [Bacteroidales bacterium]